MIESVYNLRSYLQMNEGEGEETENETDLEMKHRRSISIPAFLFSKQSQSIRS